MNTYKKLVVAKSLKLNVKYTSKQNLPNYNVIQPNVIQNQKGATLIVVLLILVLVSSIAAVAIRSGNSDLKVATADQVDKLLFQSNDAAFSKLEKEDRKKSKNTSLADLKGFILSEQMKEGESISLCVRPKLTYLFNMGYISVLTKDRDSYQNFKNGFCDSTEADDYISTKGRVLTQMTFVKDAKLVGEKEKFGDRSKGTESNDLKIEGEEGNSTDCVKFTSYATSVLPSMGNATTTEINECLDNSYTVHAGLQEDGTTVSLSDGTVSECLDESGASYETHIQIYQNLPSYGCL